jgi:hypothetical protein
MNEKCGTIGDEVRIRMVNEQAEVLIERSRHEELL